MFNEGLTQQTWVVCTFQMKVWPLTSSWKETSESWGYPASKECLCLPAALGHSRLFLLTKWFMMEVWAIQYQFDLGRARDWVRPATWALHNNMSNSQWKPWMPWFTGAFLVGNTSYMLSRTVAGRIRYCPWDSTGRWQLRACAWSLWTLPYPYKMFSII